MQDLYAKYQTTVDIANYDRSIPLVNRMVSSLKNDFTGKGKGGTILVTKWYTFGNVCWR